MLLTQDRCTKNFLVYRDPNTTKWQFFGYDLKSAMNTANGYGGVSANDYCTLTCAQWNSPLFCDRAHPQVYTHCLLQLRSSFRQRSTVIQHLHLYVRHNFNKSSVVLALLKPVCKQIRRYCCWLWTNWIKMDVGSVWLSFTQTVDVNAKFGGLSCYILGFFWKFHVQCCESSTKSLRLSQTDCFDLVKSLIATSQAALEGTTAIL